ncbi:hypothetical protein PV387_36300 [Streptomyces sp. ME02-6987-2C]|uniref:hypothetical protein n=1 Tax=unclassified Streptomyces TaxID=2593676 RepID=UPI0029B79DED|nr:MULTISPECIES: hypothetical protein [unclassified Streptomyces]MDX3345947.1 hypothetical protein [Streptomyces sp. ME02-6979A]MDX3371403.1 hypothetical protein [Streptomyces sp. ME02-6987-2C]MDX3411622.1 hypothetical protein [Streptomyces sp. ME02-6977A]MDX3421713.1 hypothetical protein [Streptomyces sp. ME02-6985-2c]
MGLGNFVRSLVPGDDAALAAQIKSDNERKAREKQAKQRAKAEEERKARARRHKEELTRKGSGAKLI